MAVSFLIWKKDGLQASVTDRFSRIQQRFKTVTNCIIYERLGAQFFNKNFEYFCRYW